MEFLQFILNFLTGGSQGQFKELFTLLEQNNFNLQEVIKNLDFEKLAPILSAFSGEKRPAPSTSQRNRPIRSRPSRRSPTAISFTPSTVILPTHDADCAVKFSVGAEPAGDDFVRFRRADARSVNGSVRYRPVNIGGGQLQRVAARRVDVRGLHDPLAVRARRIPVLVMTSVSSVMEP